jgi:hypothetical protein
MERPIRVLTWNLERCPPGRRPAVERHLEGFPYDIAVLTETRLGVLHETNVVAPDGPPPGKFAADERKVSIWSRWGWTTPEPAPSGVPSSRWVAATTVTPQGPLRVIGICVPYRFAWVHHRPPGERKRQVWEEHLRFLAGITDQVHEGETPTVVAGDLNQRVPPDPRYDPSVIVEARERALSDLEIVTAGLRGSDGKPLLCHIASSAGATQPPEVVDRVHSGGTTLSDHHGATASLSLAGP